MSVCFLEGACVIWFSFLMVSFFGVSIFAKGYLPWEDQEAKRQDFDALIKQWRAKDPTRLILIRSIEQSAMSIERMMYAQARKIEGLMQSVTLARSFCERAG